MLVRAERPVVDLQVRGLTTCSARCWKKGNREILSTLFKAFVPVKGKSGRDQAANAAAQNGSVSVADLAERGGRSRRFQEKKQACSRACREEGGTKRSVPLRQQEEIQTLPRQDGSLSALPYYEQRRSPLGSSLLYGRIGKFSRKTGGTLQKGRRFRKYVSLLPVR